MSTTQHDRTRVEELEKILQCAGCGRRPEQIETYVMPALERYAPDMPPSSKVSPEEWAASHWAAALPEERVAAIRRYVRVSETTLNPSTGAFACDICYIIAGAPTSPDGWFVPTGAEWPNTKDEFAELAKQKNMEVPQA